jgi:hypothetical protein
VESEEQLAGGNSSSVSRVGGTVRREAGAWTPRVHQLLAYLRERGIVEAPVPLGFDEQGREILAYLPGQVGNDPLPAALRGDEVLIAAARLLRRIHDAGAEIAPSWRDGWRVAAREPVETICHGDFAPYNCVFQQGRLSGVIDFDFAHPGPRAWDVSYALYRFAPLTAPSNPDGFGTFAEQCRRTRLFCDAYGLRRRSSLVEEIHARVSAVADMLLEGKANGDPRLLANIAAGHLDIYTNDLAYLDAHQEQLREAIGE